MCLDFLRFLRLLFPEFVEIVPKVDLARLPQSVSFGLW